MLAGGGVVLADGDGDDDGEGADGDRLWSCNDSMVVGSKRDCDG